MKASGIRALKRLLLGWAAVWALMGVAAAQPSPSVGATLERARVTGVITIGYRTSSVPFSFVTPKQAEPGGYSSSLCRYIVDAISEEANREVSIRWRPVTADTRLEAVRSGEVDLECGSTTNNLERQRLVAFSPTMFISGTKLLVRSNSPIHSFRELAGKKVAVTSGTTNEKTMRELSARFALNLTLVPAADHAASYDNLASGRVDAFALDDVLLYGLLAQNRSRDKFTVVGDFLSYDPYAVVFRKGDPSMEKLVMESFRRLAQEGELDRLYQRWFLQKLPTGPSVDLPMSPQLENIVRTLAARE